MSSLKGEDRLDNELGELLVHIIAAGLKAAALKRFMSNKGKPGFDAAIAKIEDTGLMINPVLEMALDRIIPEEANRGFKYGAEFLRESDEVWTGIAAKLTDVKFEKRGMAAYFVHYVQAMIQASSFIDLKKMSEDVLKPLEGHRGSEAVTKRMAEKFEEGERVISVLFGYLAMLEEHVPAKSGSFGKWIYALLWKRANGAVAADYARVREIADEFLAGSLENQALYDLALARVR